MASGGVAVELGPYGKPFEPEEAFLFDEYGGGTRSKVLRDKYLDSTVLDLLVGRYVGFTGVGVDRHRGVAASAEGGNIVEGDRVVSLFQVLFCRGANRDVQMGRAPCCSRGAAGARRLISDHIQMHGSESRRAVIRYRP